jgi:transketolase
VPEEIRGAWDAHAAGKRAEGRWRRRFKAYEAEHPELAAEFRRRMDAGLPSSFDDWIRDGAVAAQAAGQAVATRQSSQAVINGLGPKLPELLGGSADLTGSNNTRIKGTEPFSARQPAGDYLHYGVREFGMGAVMNGVVLHRGYVPFGGTFLVFSDYARSSLRMASIIEAGSIFVLTHDSIGLGEDGPTHQPVEHLASLRMIPRMEVWRPCDTAETWIAWGAAIHRRSAPTVLALTRQSLPQQPRDAAQLAAIRRGGYVLLDAGGEPDCILIATGSEVALAIEAARELAARGRKARVVSMPCTSVFDAQDAAWRNEVLPPAVTARVAIEAGVAEGWWRYVGPRGRVVGMRSFGASAPGKDLFRHFGFTSAAVVEAAESSLNGE